MNWVDVVIILFAIAAVGRGLRIGFFRQAFSIAGFFVGLLLGSLALSHMLNFIHDTTIHALVTSSLVLFLATVGAVMGELLGMRVHLALGNGWIKKVEAAFGVVLSVLSVLLAAWLLGSILVRLPFEGLSNSVADSAIIQSLDRRLPPASHALATLNKFVTPNGFPQVFTGAEPSNAPLAHPVAADVKAATDKATAATVKINGFGCGGIVSGSGFVIAPGLVATNAHVLAGVRRPIVKNGEVSYAATPVLFDPNLDFAVLKVSGLSNPSLPLDDKDVPGNTTIAALGFPGGGDFKSDPGVILNKTKALGRNIYGHGIISRDIYIVQADVEPGNSGGPAVLPDGSVAGVIFAKATGADGLGYALTSKSVLSEARQAQSATARVSTGPCATE